MPAYLCSDDATLIMVDLYVRSFAKIDDVKMEYRYGKGLLDVEVQVHKIIKGIVREGVGEQVREEFRTHGRTMREHTPKFYICEEFDWGGRIYFFL